MKWRCLFSFNTLFLISIWLLASKSAIAQLDDTISQKRQKKFYIYGGVVYTGSLIALNELWYSDYPRSSFHTFNDNGQWLQVDKAGHIYSGFTLSKLNYAALNGNNSTANKKLAVVSAATSFTFLTAIEVFDGFSAEWGFSWGDMAANTIGSGIFLAQQLLFEKQVLQIKYSFHPSDYRELRPNTLGENEMQGAFKDYNGQTYWASLNLNGMYKKIEPKWLNIAFGYGGEGMVFANNTQTFEGIKSYRQYHISLDIDFERIETNKKWLKTIFKLANCIKVPAPTLELNGNGTSSFHWLYF